MAKPNILCDCAGLSNDRWLEYRAHGPKGDIRQEIMLHLVKAIPQFGKLME